MFPAFSKSLSDRKDSQRKNSYMKSQKTVWVSEGTQSWVVTYTNCTISHKSQRKDTFKGHFFWKDSGLTKRSHAKTQHFLVIFHRFGLLWLEFMNSKDIEWFSGWKTEKIGQNM